MQRRRNTAVDIGIVAGWAFAAVASCFVLFSVLQTMNVSDNSTNTNMAALSNANDRLITGSISKGDRPAIQTVTLQETLQQSAQLKEPANQIQLTALATKASRFERAQRDQNRMVEDLHTEITALRRTVSALREGNATMLKRIGKLERVDDKTMVKPGTIRVISTQSPLTVPTSVVTVQNMPVSILKDDLLLASKKQNISRAPDIPPYMKNDASILPILRQLPRFKPKQSGQANTTSTMQMAPIVTINDRVNTATKMVDTASIPKRKVITTIAIADFLRLTNNSEPGIDPVIVGSIGNAATNVSDQVQVGTTSIITDYVRIERRPMDVNNLPTIDLVDQIELGDLQISNSGTRPVLPSGRRLSSSSLHTEFGVDFGGFASLSQLQTEWAQIKLRHGTRVSRLQPLAIIRDGLNKLEVHLIVGPFRNAAEAATLCAEMKSLGQICKSSLYKGQDLASK